MSKLGSVNILCRCVAILVEKNWLDTCEMLIHDYFVDESDEFKNKKNLIEIEDLVRSTMKRIKSKQEALISKLTTFKGTILINPVF